MRIVILGSNGQLGHDLVRVIPQEECIPLTRAECDVTQLEKIRENLNTLKPDIVVNTTAYNRVDDCEKDASISFSVNAIGAHNVAIACKEVGARLVHFSTDYVFGQDKIRQKPYTEEDHAGPVNAYGVSKFAGELLVQEVFEKHFVVRVCGLFGVAGSSGKGGNFVETMIRIGKEKGAVCVVSDQVLVPTYTLDIAKNVYNLMKTDAYGLYHMASHGHTSWWNFAKTIFEFSGLKVECTPIPSSEFSTSAKRPTYSVLENAKLRALGIDQMRQWEEALKDYLIEKGHRKG